MDFLPLRSLCLLNRLEKREFLPCLFVPLCLRVSLPLFGSYAFEWPFQMPKPALYTVKISFSLVARWASILPIYWSVSFWSSFSAISS